MEAGRFLVSAKSAAIAGSRTCRMRNGGHSRYFAENDPFENLTELTAAIGYKLGVVPAETDK